MVEAKQAAHARTEGKRAKAATEKGVYDED